MLTTDICIFKVSLLLIYYKLIMALLSDITLSDKTPDFKTGVDFISISLEHQVDTTISITFFRR